MVLVMAGAQLSLLTVFVPVCMYRSVIDHASSTLDGDIAVRLLVFTISLR